MTKLLTEWNAPIVLREEYMHEICRYGASELPSVAAFVGKTNLIALKCL